MIKINKDFIAGAAFGFGAGFFTGRSKYFETQSFKDLAKSAMKTGLSKFEAARETAMRGAEIFEDLFFEVRTEMKEEAEAVNEAQFAAAVDVEPNPQTEFATDKAAGERAPEKPARKRSSKEATRSQVM